MVTFSRDYRIVIGVSSIALVVFILSLVSYSYLKPTSREATLAIAFENEGQGRVFTGEVTDGMTVLDALITSAQAGQIIFQYEVDSRGKTRIIGLDGYAKQEKSLVFYLNNIKIDSQNINSIKIEPGDIVEVRLE